jgi:hypothetical protein
MQKFSIDSIPEFVKVKHIQYGNKDTKYHYSIYNLENEFIPNADLKNRIYRSAILSAENKILALAPAKSLPNMLSGNKFSVNEIIEGTMVNMFWDPNLESWEISTKKNIGGNYFFFRNNYDGELEEPEQKTFRQMFLEVFPLNNLPFDKSYSYSFVLQHPCNHIVLTIENPALYLVMTYKIEEDNTYAYVNPKSHPNYEDFVKMGVKFSRDFVSSPSGRKTLEQQLETSTNYVLEQIPNLEEALSNPLNEYTNVGIMVTDQETGFRTAYHNKIYLEVKSLRGNNPNLHYQYLMLRKIGKVSEFLRYFPLYRKHFNKFLEHFTLFSERIYKLYWEVHVKKTVSVSDIPEKHDKYFVEKIHYEVFLPKHKEDKKFFINKKEVEKLLDRENVMIPF